MLAGEILRCNLCDLGHNGAIECSHATTRQRLLPIRPKKAGRPRHRLQRDRLRIIAMLKATRESTAIASDFSPHVAPCPTACGADVAVDPAEHSPYTSFEDCCITCAVAELDLAVDSGDQASASSLSCPGST